MWVKYELENGQEFVIDSCRDSIDYDDIVNGKIKFLGAAEEPEDRYDGINTYLQMKKGYKGRPNFEEAEGLKSVKSLEGLFAQMTVDADQVAVDDLVEQVAKTHLPGGAFVSTVYLKDSEEWETILFDKDFQAIDEVRTKNRDESIVNHDIFALQNKDRSIRSIIQCIISFLMYPANRDRSAQKLSKKIRGTKWQREHQSI